MYFQLSIMYCMYNVAGIKENHNNVTCLPFILSTSDGRELHTGLFPALGKKNKTQEFSDFVQFGFKILHQGGFFHSPWEILLAATASDFVTVCSLWSRQQRSILIQIQSQKPLEWGFTSLIHYPYGKSCRATKDSCVTCMRR